MRSAPNEIPKDQFWARTNAIMPKLISQGKANNEEELKELYRLHNDVVYPPVTKTSCCSCRARVFRKMQEIYNNKAI